MMMIPDVIKDEYTRKRRMAEDEAKKRLEYIYKVCPDIEKFDKQIIKLAYDLGLLGLRGDEFAAAKEKTLAAIDVLKKERKMRLRLLGFPENYTDTAYECDMCKDTGFVGETIRTLCPCIKQRIIEYRYSTSNINQEECFEKFNFDLFSHNSKQLSIMKTLYAYAKEYADSLPDNVSVPNLILFGNTGLGKSYLLNCIAKVAIEKSLFTIKITSYNLISAFMENIRHGAEVPDFIGCDVLLIDDLGTEPTITNITVETIFLILNERIALSRPTIIATNCMPDELGELYGERVLSRLFAPRVSMSVHLEGDDLRLSK